MHSSMPESASGGGCLLPGGGMSAPGEGGVCSGGFVCSWGVSAPRRGCLLPGGGVCYRGVSASGGVSAPGRVYSGEVSALGGVWSWGVSTLGVGGCLLLRASARGVSAFGGVCSRRGYLFLGGGVCSQGGIPACTEADTPLVNRMTNRCKNITLATTSLRPVKTHMQNTFSCRILFSSSASNLTARWGVFFVRSIGSS